MLRSSLVWLVVLASAGQAQASSWAERMFDELSRDFGCVPRGTILVYPFRVANNTGAPVRISHLRVSCGCTSVRALQGTLAPGEETAIVAEMDTRRFSLFKRVTIYVQFDQPRFEEVRLSVEANCRDDLAIVPESLALGRVKHGSPAAGRVTVSLLGSDIAVTEVKCDSNFVQPSVKRAPSAQGEVNYEVEARLRPDTPVGKWFTEIWLTTNRPDLPRLRVPVTVEVEPAASAKATKVSFGQVRLGTPTARKLILRATRPFRITGIAGSDSTLQVLDATPEHTTEHVLTVRVRPDQAGELRRRIRVQTDLKDRGEIEFVTEIEVVP